MGVRSAAKWARWIVISSLLVACSGEHETPEPTAPVAREDLCAQLALANCEAVSDCCSVEDEDGWSLESCVERARTGCESRVAGYRAYDTEQASSIVVQIKADLNSCKLPMTDVLTSEVFPDFRSEGESCDTGFCADELECWDGTCKRRREPGESCKQISDCRSFMCVLNDQNQPVCGSCQSDDDCAALDLRSCADGDCVALTCQQGNCDVPGGKAEGQACVLDTQCLTEHCIGGVCATPEQRSFCE